jgi:hypothetical protein
MENTTKALLRNAILEALSAEQDASAMELMTILNGSSALAATAKPIQLALPPVRKIENGPAHDYHYWVAFIRENFIPFMAANGRLRFTSPELLTWLENSPNLVLTAGDIEQHSTGRETWRNSVSAALSAMKQRGVLKAPAFGKDYEILNHAFAGANQ